MSVLNQSGEEQVECPLCMEPLEVDDLNFYPCTCGYQICRFCWHRIRTDENGLCPACRKAYSENPADFTPLSKEQVAQLKAEKRQRDQQRKAKLSESRKHLASVRVVQKNLVFVVGLPVRLADADVLKRHEYFGKFGKIHKVVINQSTSYAGSQGPSASAYVTYVKSDDALRAIQSVNNVMLDGRVIKSSLGTTKYCSHFMKNQPCPKADCMYLHDFGDREASFTKEEMHIGKHQEYEKKLHEALLSRTAAAQQQQSTTAPDRGGSQTNSAGDAKTKHGSKESTRSTPCNSNATTTSTVSTTMVTTTVTTTTDSNGFANTTTHSKTDKQKPDSKSSEKSQKKNNQKNKNNNNNNNTNSSNNNNIEPVKKSEKSRNCEQTNCIQQHQRQNSPSDSVDKVATTVPTTIAGPTAPQTKEVPAVTSPNDQPTSGCVDSLMKMQLVDENSSFAKMQLLDDNSSFFSQNTFQKLLPENDSSSYSTDSSPHSNILNDSLPDINSSEDWQTVFGLTPTAIVAPPKLEQTAYHLDSYQKPYQKVQPTQTTYDESKLRDSILDILSNRTSTTTAPTLPSAGPYRIENGLNGLDQQMSKFFAEFNKSQQQNGYTTLAQQNSYLGNEHHNMLLNQQQRYLDKRLEEQVLYNNLKQQQQQQQQQGLFHHPATPYLHTNTTLHHRHNNLQHPQQQYLANGGDHFLATNQNVQHFVGNNTSAPFTVFQNQSLQQRSPAQIRDTRSSVVDDLGFDPFHETQKALAELIESEQGVPTTPHSTSSASNNGTNSSSSASSVGSTVNELLHGPAPGNCLPPPPPGFMQHNTHMNSFGSKILPFLNMSSNQQFGWSQNYSETQMKNTSPLNDWMTLDPAIVSSGRHFPLANIQSYDQYGSTFCNQQQQQHQTSNAVRGNFEFQQPLPAQQLQNGYNTYGHLHHVTSHHHPFSYLANNNNNNNGSLQQNGGVNWFNGDIHGQITSPPGFRQGAAATAQSKTQEC